MANFSQALLTPQIVGEWPGCWCSASRDAQPGEQQLGAAQLGQWTEATLEQLKCRAVAKNK